MILKRAIRLLGGAVAILMVGYVALWNYWVGARLAAGAERLHTRFFSERLRIAPGMDVERIGLQDRLERLRYRRDDALPAPGTWRRRGGGFEIRTRAFADADGSLPERRARVDVDGKRIKTVVDVPTGEPRSQLTLEPIALGATWNGRWELRRSVTLADLPEHAVDALLATEDTRFRRHTGVDFVGVARAVRANVRAGRLVEGGSTITQQLARTLFLGNDRTWRRKLDELVIALLLEVRLSKEQILELYVNEIYLGRHGSMSIVGYGEAARTFFGKDAAQLTVGEAATIAGIIRAPNPGSPLRNPRRARRQRDATLDRMVVERLLMPAAAAAAKREPLPAKPSARPAVDGAFLLEAARAEMERAVGADALVGGGLDVYTTMDPGMQREAERGVAATLAALERSHRWLRGREPPLEAAVVLVDLHDGGVRALVGGRDFGRRPFDRAVTARRQAGSTFKPLVYLSAFVRDPGGFTSASLLDDSPLALRTGGDVWKPGNYDQRFRGPVTVRTALERSLNVPTVRLALTVGIDEVARTATDAGWPGALPRVPALALGVADVSLLEIAGLYTVFPRLGSVVTPHVVRGAVGRGGTVVYRRDDAPRPVVDPAAAYLVHHLLEGVVDRGTARRLRGQGLTGPLAGKTGTTNDYRDAWFVGYAPDLLAATWVGFDDGRPLKLPSSATALDVWSAVMRPVLAGQPRGRFPVPPGIAFADVDPETGLLATATCPGIREAFRIGTEPRRTCDGWRGPERFPVEEPLEAPTRVIEGWLREMRRLFQREPRGR